MSWIAIKWKFRVENKRILYASQKDNKEWTNIYLEKKQKKII